MVLSNKYPKIKHNFEHLDHYNLHVGDFLRNYLVTLINWKFGSIKNTFFHFIGALTTRKLSLHPSELSQWLSKCSYD